MISASKNVRLVAAPVPLTLLDDLDNCRDMYDTILAGFIGAQENGLESFIDIRSPDTGCRAVGALYCR